MFNRIFHVVIATSLTVSLFGEVEASRYERIRDFLSCKDSRAAGTPDYATYLTASPELFGAEAGEGGFLAVFVHATVPGGDVDTTYDGIVDLVCHEGVENGSAKIYPGFIPDTTSPQTSVQLSGGTAIVWIRDDEEEELIFTAVPRDSLKASIPSVLTIHPSSDSATRLLIDGNEKINAGEGMPNRYLIKAVDDSFLVDPSYTGFINPTKRVAITLSESNPNGSAYFVDLLWDTSGPSISTYLISGVANVFLFDTEPETLILVSTVSLGDLDPDTFTVEVLPPDEVMHVFLVSMSGSFGTVSVEKSVFALAFNFYSEMPDPSNNSSQVELRINDIIGTGSVSVSPSYAIPMTSGIAQFRLLDTEADIGVIAQPLTSGVPELYPFLLDKIAYGFKPPGEAILAATSFPTTCVVGDTATLTIWAVDGLCSVDSSYSGWIQMYIEEEYDNGSASLLEYPTGAPQEIVHIENGVGRIWLSDDEVEEIGIRIEDAEGSFPLGSYLGSQTPDQVGVVRFEPPGDLATRWMVELPARGTVGVTQTGTIKAVDDSGYVDTAFVDTASLSSTGNATLSDSMLVLVNGVATFTVVDDSTEPVIVAAQDGGLIAGEDTITFASRGMAAKIAAITATRSLVNDELEIALVAVSPEFEFDNSWNGVGKLIVTDPGSASITALSGNLDSIPIINGAGGITIVNHEVEVFELEAEWVSGDPPLEAYPAEKIESEVKLVVILPESIFVGGTYDTISFETRDAGDLVFPYTTWAGIYWDESIPNGSVAFDGRTDSIPLIDGRGFIGIEDSEDERVRIWVYTDDELIAERSSYCGEMHFSSVGVGEVRITTRMTHRLWSGRPNPFMESTRIAYSVGGTGAVPVRLHIYDAGGRLVKTLVDGRVSPGLRSVLWDGKDAVGKKVASGVYFCRMEVDEYTATKKICVVR